MVWDNIKFFSFENPKCLMIAESKDVAVVTCQEKFFVSSDPYFEELEVEDFLEKLSATGTEGIQTIERGIIRAMTDVQQAISTIANGEESAVILSDERAFK